MTKKQFYTTNEAASLLGLKPRSVTRHIERHNLKAEKIGRDHLILPEELERFMQEGRRTVGRPRAEKIEEEQAYKRKPSME